MYFISKLETWLFLTKLFYNSVDLFEKNVNVAK